MSIATRVATLGPDLCARLIADFGLTPAQACGAVGNLAHESGLVAGIQEGAPRAGRGGCGLAQWTGPRRRDFEAFCANLGKPVTDWDANYAFLRRELQTAYRGTIIALKGTNTIEAATESFERSFERAGVVNMASRVRLAEMCLAAWQSRNEKPPKPEPAPAEPPAEDPVAEHVKAVRELQHTLKQIGTYGGRVDGSAGPLTRGAIANLQAMVGLPTTGTCDEATWRAVDAAVADQTPAPAENAGLPKKERSPMSGYKTVSFGAALVAVGGFLSTLTPDQIAAVVPPQYLPLVVSGIGAVVTVLRLLTKTPVGVAKS